jgi:hypothetical protein
MNATARSCIFWTAVLLFGMGRDARAANSPAGSSRTEARVRDGSHDFDFLYGSWLMHNRHLKGEPFTGSKEWVSFDSTDRCIPLPGGLGDEDAYRTDRYFGKGFVGLTIRLYDRRTGLWRIYWIDNRNSHGDAGQPNVGRFDGHVGIFDEHFVFHGRPVIDRYTWTKYGRGSKITAHFAESMSRDDGKTWEVLFVNDLVRAEPAAGASSALHGLR